MASHTNCALTLDESPSHTSAASPTTPQQDATASTVNVQIARDRWGRDIEFLFSCIALSVGLGNVWRFPVIALENGGGAFVIPYLVVLICVGRPVYYLEMLVGQFSSRGAIRVFDFSPLFRGIGYGQVLATGFVTTYYASIMGITLRYFFASLTTDELPWNKCKPSWNDSQVICIDSRLKNTFGGLSSDSRRPITSAELYFTNEILKEKDSIEDGIGWPDMILLGCLALSWTVVCLTLIRGVKSSGKASYVLAIFPYIVLGILLVRAVTLPGSTDGILFFITPQWEQLLEPKVWYSAVTQVFFSLTVCFGNIIMYASYNRFNLKISRDVNIITTIDTATSLLAGFVIFGILGNLAHEIGTDDIRSVVRGGAGLAFISYPDALSKFTFAPQVFSALFFLMLFALGIGSNVGMTSCIMTVIRDKFPTLHHWKVVLGIGLVGLCLGSIFLTPGGQYILNLVDFFGASFIALVLAILELVSIAWVYGVKRLCKDVEFMLHIRIGWYWRLCWGFITPIMMACILIYTIVKLEPLTYRDQTYPTAAYAAGWILSTLGLMQFPLWALYAIKKQKVQGVWNKLHSALQPKANWGPLDENLLREYQSYTAKHMRESEPHWRQMNFFEKIRDKIFN
ncbi:sodium-dependent nutrient amino acid transporter 1-like [Lutzomyia longipalpis]|uniref:sodium-dependent nutrient amino acid transporter 1-like n=1 Tax=Lutzomyia longipalpis TaxID=7200 RepID=UPI002483DEC5|nr:sodium-dependent nutrient amino acid transporter 1-like [Lutzomyia longipalpis]